MPIEEMSAVELAAAHREMLDKAHRARNEGDLDLAQKYLAIVRPMNFEMSRRMRASFEP